MNIYRFGKNLVFCTLVTICVFPGDCSGSSSPLLHEDVMTSAEEEAAQAQERADLLQSLGMLGLGVTITVAAPVIDMIIVSGGKVLYSTLFSSDYIENMTPLQSLFVASTIFYLLTRKTTKDVVEYVVKDLNNIYQYWKEKGTQAAHTAYGYAQGAGRTIRSYIPSGSE